MTDLEETLLEAAESALDGSPYGGLLAGRIQREVTTAMRRLGLQGTVRVHDGGRRVEVLLRQGPRVRTVHLSLARG